MNSSKKNNGFSPTIYVVKDIEGNVRFKGTAREIEKIFGIKAQNVQAYYNITHVYNDRYLIDKENSGDEVYEYLLKHIKMYGNTVLSGMNRRRVEKYLAMLKERDGIECTYKRIKYKEDSGAWYVITRRKDDV